MAGRSYGRYCPVARTLELVGERWTLLLVRELLLGPMRFTDLHTALEGIPRNLLADRLRDLEGHRLVTRRELPPPAARTVYELTERGRALMPAIGELARWGLTHLETPAQDEPVSSSMAVLAGLVAHARPIAAGEERYDLDVDGRHFTLRLDGGGIRFGEPAAAGDLAVSVSASTLLRLRLGAETLDGAVAAGRLRFRPDDPALAGRFAERFALSQEDRS
ncbi:MAG TPA: winged helix-turn-helix transcriptional regulator [Candidatus Dormibacteraeota bacterium]|nr:winged helix-turn-helix transcriptional regulator [Candidatus Dormibacteraeota bacterium]